MRVETDRVLLAGYLNDRDAEAFGEIVRRYAGMVFGVARRVTGNSAMAEDVTQDCFLGLAREGRRVGESVAGWLHGAAVHRAMDLKRNQAVRKQYESGAGERAGERSTEFDRVILELDVAMEELAEEMRAVLVKKFLCGKTQEEIAGDLGVDQSTVSRRVEKGLAALREKLAKVGIVGAVDAALVSCGGCAAPARLMMNLNKLAMAGVRGAGTRSVMTGIRGASTTSGMGIGVAKSTTLAIAAWVVALVAVGIGMIAVSRMKPAAQGTKMAAATTRAAAGPMMVRFRDGTTCELIGVADARTKQWWKADGTAMKAPFPVRDWVRRDVPDAKAEMRYLYLVTQATGPRGTSIEHVNGRSEGFSNRATIGLDEGGKKYRIDLAEVKPEIDVVRHGILIPSKPTAVEVKLDGRAGWNAGMSAEKRVEGVGMLRLEKPREEGGKTVVEGEWPSGLKDYSVTAEIVTVDQKSPGSSSIGSSGKEGHYRLDFDRPLGKVAEIELRATHWDQWVEFRNVSTHLGKMTEATAEKSDAPATQASADEMEMPEAFDKAVDKDNLAEVRKMLEAEPRLAKSKYTDGYTGLCTVHSVAMATLLVEYGADLNAQTHRVLANGASGTPMRYAANWNRKDVIVYLLGQGAKVEDIHMAVATGEVERVEAMLGKDPNLLTARSGKDDALLSDATPLHVAGWCGETEVARMLIEKGAELDAMGMKGGTPLMAAVWTGHLETAELLLDRGADLEKKAKNGSTALTWAVSAGRKHAVKMLLDRGAKVYPAMLKVAQKSREGTFTGATKEDYLEIEGMLKNRVGKNAPLSGRG